MGQRLILYYWSWYLMVYHKTLPSTGDNVSTDCNFYCLQNKRHGRWNYRVKNPYFTFMGQRVRLAYWFSELVNIDRRVSLKISGVWWQSLFYDVSNPLSSQFFLFFRNVFFFSIQIACLSQWAIHANVTSISGIDLHR